MTATTTEAVAVPCRQCGYDLRTLPTDGLCPECGLVIAASVGVDPLAGGGPAWIATLRAGAACLFAGLVVWLADSLLTFAVVFAAFFRIVMPHGVVLFAHAGGPVLQAVGGWLLTVPRPDRPEVARERVLRQLVRATLCAAAAERVLNLVPAISMWRHGSDHWIAAYVIAHLATACSIAGPVAALVQLGRLAGQLPDERLVERAVGLAYAMGGPLALGWMIGTVQLAMWIVGGPEMNRTVIGVVTGLIGLAVLAATGVYLHLLAVLWARLGAEANRPASTATDG